MSEVPTLKDELIRLVEVAQREKQMVEDRLDDLGDTLEMLLEKLEELELEDES